eukprot:jgi/Mesen1/8476/ME000478S07964
MWIMKDLDLEKVELELRPARLRPGIYIVGKGKAKAGRGPQVSFFNTVVKRFHLSPSGNLAVTNARGAAISANIGLQVTILNSVIRDNYAAAAAANGWVGRGSRLVALSPGSPSLFSGNLTSSIAKNTSKLSVPLSPPAPAPLPATVAPPPPAAISTVWNPLLGCGFATAATPLEVLLSGSASKYTEFANLVLNISDSQSGVQPGTQAGLFWHIGGPSKWQQQRR